MSKELVEIKTMLENHFNIKLSTRDEISRAYLSTIIVLEKYNNEVLEKIDMMIGIINYYKSCFDMLLAAV